VIQATVKIVVFPEAVNRTFALVWMLASALVPLLAFLVPRPQQGHARADGLRLRT
jgi:hypothetical protein